MLRVRATMTAVCLPTLTPPFLVTVYIPYLIILGRFVAVTEVELKL